MSLLTKEQQEEVDRIRKLTNSRKQWALDSGGWINEAENLIEIIDDLQARAPKQYTEQELRESFEQSHLARVIGVFDRFEENGMYKNPMIQARFDGWKSCARHVGALKAEP